MTLCATNIHKPVIPITTGWMVWCIEGLLWHLGFCSVRLRLFTIVPGALWKWGEGMQIYGAGGWPEKSGCFPRWRSAILGLCHKCATLEGYGHAEKAIICRRNGVFYYLWHNWHTPAWACNQSSPNRMALCHNMLQLPNMLHSQCSDNLNFHPSEGTES